ncbi:hypothetical protein CRG98_044659 [Punica granatum]|uniref:Transmembrane protein n=1 Tax=Punica granatum TaxID=22663 RepID=A0A2I0HTP8_PUNGR|nr:hypothetical protein CRG98_044659 [Punica granatum]
MAGSEISFMHVALFLVALFLVATALPTHSDSSDVEHSGIVVSGLNNSIPDGMNVKLTIGGGFLFVGLVSQAMVLLNNITMVF